MALLNYALVLTDAIKSNYLLKYKNSSGTLVDNSTGTIDKSALVFTGDGHIITHGVDYTLTILDSVTKQISTDGLDNLQFRTQNNNNNKLLNSFLYTKGKTDSSNNLIWETVLLNIDTALKVANDLIIKWGTGTTEGTNLFTYNGSEAKTIQITAEKLSALTQSLLTLGDNETAFDYNSTKIYSALKVDELIKTKIENALTASLQYKGTVTTETNGNHFNANGVLVDANNQQINPKKGDVYKVGVAATALKTYKIGNTTYNKLEVGDTLVYNGTSWDILQNNIDAGTSTINGNVVTFYGSNIPTSLYAPTTYGTAGLVLVSDGAVDNTTVGKAPKWINVAPNVTITNGKIKIGVLGKFSANDDGVEIVASKTKASLSTGEGLAFNSAGAFDGSVAKTLRIVAATDALFGGLKLLQAATTIKLSSATSTPTGFTKSNSLSSTANRYYPVGLDANGVAYVNIPWVDTWRPIRYNNTAIDSDNTLNLAPGANIFMTKSQSDKVTTLTFDLDWFDLDNNKYERQS